jgi:hypothetical protein
MQLAGRLFALACAWVAILAGFALLVASSADARRPDVRLHIRQVSGEPAFRGHIETPHRACHVARRVRIYHELPESDPVVARTRTHRDGSWRVRLAHQRYRPATYYYARIAPKRVGERRCIGAKSPYAEAL